MLTLTKEAASNVDLIESYKKVPKSVVMSELSEINVEAWQREWDLTSKRVQLQRSSCI